MITKVWNRKYLLIVSELRCAHQHSAICHPLRILIRNTCQHAHVSTYKNVCVGTFTFDMIIYVEEVRGNCFQNGTKGQLGKSESKQPQNKHTHTPQNFKCLIGKGCFFFFSSKEFLSKWSFQYKQFCIIASFTDIPQSWHRMSASLT